MTIVPGQRSPLEELPTELHDKVASRTLLKFLGSLIQQQKRIFSHLKELYTSAHIYKSYGNYKTIPYEFVRNVLRGYDHLFWPGIWNLRLVSKAVYGSATRYFFKHAFAPFYALKNDTGRRTQDWILAANSTLPRVIRRAKFEISDGEKRKTEMMFLSGMSEEKVRAFRIFMSILPSTIAKLEMLECLSVSMPEGWYCKYNGHESDHGPNLDLLLLDELRSGLVSMLTTPKFELLTDLGLLLPCTYDFVVLDHALSGDFLKRLRHLYLGFINASGTVGSRDYLRWFEEDDDGDDGVPFSNLQERYPNTEYMNGIFKIVKRCPNLESLGLSGTQMLDFDLLEWQPRAGGLECLYLKRATVKVDSLKQLLSPALVLDGSSPLFSVWLDEVELRTRTWFDVFEHLLQCPSPSYFNPNNLTYARYSEFPEFKVYAYRPWEDNATYLVIMTQMGMPWLP